ncbi:MAG: hypothetical protein AAF497_17790, partial [Planctomycetota bacterium]
MANILLNESTDNRAALSRMLTGTVQVHNGELATAVAILHLQSIIASFFSLYFGSYPLIMIAWLIGVPSLFAAAHAGRSHFASRLLLFVLIAILVSTVVEACMHWAMAYGFQPLLLLNSRLLFGVSAIVVWTWTLYRHFSDFGRL